MTSSSSYHREIELAFVFAIGALFATAAPWFLHRFTDVGTRLPAVARRSAKRGPAGGRITLAGCGPGAPELLTLAAYSALAEADVVISDLIAPPALRAMTRPGAEFHVRAS